MKEYISKFLSEMTYLIFDADRINEKKIALL